MPASFCGIVGIKPTWGLVPYTGVIGLDPSIDHTGPMAANVLDCALLLEVIAGSDGLDDRQQDSNTHGAIKYASGVSDFLQRTSVHHLLDGIRIGILKEGYGLESSDPNVDNAILAAIAKFKDLGGDVRTCSLPGHSTGQLIWSLSTFAGSYRQHALGDMQGRKQVYMTERIERSKVGQAEFDAAGPGARNMLLSGMFLDRHYGPGLYARCKNLTRKLSVCMLFPSSHYGSDCELIYGLKDEYDRAFKDFDVLITPTTPFAAPRHALYDRPDARLSAAIGLTFNTSPLDATGHPAISIPVGFVLAPDDANVRLPVGMQLIGPKFGELLLLQVAGSWEYANNWKGNYFGKELP